MQLYNNCIRENFGFNFNDGTILANIFNDILELKNAQLGARIDKEILEIIRTRYPAILEGMDVYIDDALDEDEAADEVPDLVIEGDEREAPRTIFVDYEALFGDEDFDFESACLNILALTKEN